MLGLSEDNNEFVSFLGSDHGQKIILTENSLSIHTESDNIFYDNFNTNKNPYNFLPAQQDNTKKFIGKTISYYGQFEKYIKQYLSAFTINEIEKSDIATIKNFKYLLYRFNDWIYSLDAEKIKIKDSSTVKDDVGILGIQKKTCNFQ